MSRFMEYAMRTSRAMRARRFQHFEELAGALPRPLSILDLGGTNAFWERVGWAGRSDVQITCLNLDPQKKVHDNITPVEGDATDLSGYGTGEFHITFSNSVLEHLFTYEKQSAMASGMVRVGQAYWCQTPNYWFPMEPHFHVVGWHWLPKNLRVEILRRRTCGFRSRMPDRDAALKSVSEVRLVGRRELERLFPSGTLIAERYFGLVKSWTVYGGFHR